MKKKIIYSFASIEQKKHPKLNKFNFDYSQKYKKSLSNNILSSEILNLFSFHIGKNFFKSSGEWNWLYKNKQKKFIKIISQKNSISLSDYLTNMFRKETTYGYLSPSFGDCLKNKNQTSSDILNNIDSCIEFTDLIKISDLKNNVGNPYGLKISNGMVLPDTPRHYYYAYNIFNLLKNVSNPFIIEIGGGYGGTALQLWKRYKGKATIINIDLLPATIIAYFFLKKNGIQVNLIREKKDLKKNTINLIVFDRKISLKSIIQKCHLIFNSRSLSEMSKDSIKYYFDYINSLKCKFFYHENSNFLLFPKSKRHKEILADKFPINKKMYSLQSKFISPFTGGSGRYREYIYKSN